jgi:hypothetical protein
MALAPEWKTRLAHYLVSLPERVVRSAAGLSAGILREAGDVAVPAGLRRTRLYHNLVETTLRFLIEEVGQVEGTFPGAERLAKNFALRRAAGNGIELAGILAFRASPVWVLAALADLSGAGRRLIREISETLRKEGLLEPGARFDTIDELLDGLERSAGRLASAVNTPPLDVAGLRREWEDLKREAPKLPSFQLPSPAALEAVWSALVQEAQAQRRSVFEVSSVMALSAARKLPAGLSWLSKSARLAARRTGEIAGEALIGHYRQSVEEIRRVGFLAYWAREFRPYLLGAARQLSPSSATLTGRWLDRRG